MIAPGSIGDWAVSTGMLGSLSVLAVCLHRWVLRGAATPERVRSNPIARQATPSTRVSR
jgi:hypothetical protein